MQWAQQDLSQRPEPEDQVGMVGRTKMPHGPRRVHAHGQGSPLDCDDVATLGGRMEPSQLLPGAQPAFQACATVVIPSRYWSKWVVHVVHVVPLSCHSLVDFLETELVDEAMTTLERLLVHHKLFHPEYPE